MIYQLCHNFRYSAKAIQQLRDMLKQAISAPVPELVSCSDTVPYLVRDGA